MYNKSILTNLGFEEWEVRAIIRHNERISERISKVKKQINELVLDLSDNTYNTLLETVEKSLLNRFLEESYCEELEPEEAFEVIKLNKDSFKKNFNLNKSYSWVPYHGYTEVESILFIANKSNSINFYGIGFSDDNLKDVEDKFNLKFELSNHFEGDCDGDCDDRYTRSNFINNPVKNDDEKLILLTVYHTYQNGEPGYESYDLKTKLYIVE